mmetsp:Transcript_25844/g.39606  ORF Transcript_25844/g.39606 Transcript_25844/m.39606 type:complete len:200 (-) Transcript_25844:10221-10820(-)
MSRYLGPKLRIIRRLGKLPGLTVKKSKKKGRPGKALSQKKESKKKEYGLRLEEKQKLRFNYGITETQLFSYVKEAKRRKGITGLILLQLLEMRLDSICYQSGWVKSIAHARQLINHGHIKVNNKKLTIPSFQCELKDIIELTNSNKTFEDTFERKDLNSPSHLEVDFKNFKIKVLDYCVRENLPIKLNELLIIEYYSRN